MNQLYYTRTLPEDSQVSDNGPGAHPSSTRIIVSENGQLTLDVIQNLKNTQPEDQPGVIVMIPPAFESMREELEGQLLDAGICVIPPSMMEVIPDRGPLVIGPGFIDPLVARITEDDFHRVRLIEPESPYLSAPTAMKRGGNNKPWYDLELKRRKAKIAKQSKRRNRK